MNDLEIKKKLLLALRNIREQSSKFRYVHAFSNDKFCKSIIKFIVENFDPAEHCFVFCGGLPHEVMPIPDLPNVFSFPNAFCLKNSPAVEKFIFHGMYQGGIGQHLYDNRDMLAKSYWLTWGRDIYETDGDDEKLTFVKGHMQGVAVNNHAKKIYLRKYGDYPAFFPYNITYESIPYELIKSTVPPRKDYIQALVNNSAHETTLEVLENLARFGGENLRVATILSYGDYPFKEHIVKRGVSLFGDKFIPIRQFMPPEQYIKFLARNDIYIINQHRPQGMTTFYAMALLGKKIYMRPELSEYLRDDGYAISSVEDIPSCSWREFTRQEGVEQNRLLAGQRFDREHVRNFWESIFSHRPLKRAAS